MCEESKFLQLHHKTYKNLGNEKLSDLVYLCNKCHHETHDYLEVTESKVDSTLLLKGIVKKKNQAKSKKSEVKKFKIISGVKVFDNLNTKGKYYAIRLQSGEKVIVRSWDECKNYTHRKAGVKFKSFDGLEVAITWVNNTK